jgi:hypothetical protein
VLFRSSFDIDERLVTDLIDAAKAVWTALAAAVRAQG